MLVLFLNEHGQFDSQMAGMLPMYLPFDKKEFTRHFDEDFIRGYQINPNDKQAIANAIRMRENMVASLLLLQLNARITT